MPFLEKDFQNLTNNIDIGVFRTDISRKPQFLDANPAAIKIFGFTNKQELLDSSILTLFHTQAERKLFLKELFKNGKVKNKIIKLKTNLNKLAILSLSVNLVKDEKGKPVFADGFVEDITQIKKLEKERDYLILNLQTSLLLSEQPIPNLIKDIQKAKTANKVIELSKHIPFIVKTLIDCTMNAKYITKITASFADEIINKFINLAIKEIGDPPVKFSFIVMGSEGREAQTIKTDQDNAIIYENTENEEIAKDYFLELGSKVCDWLNEADYPYCKGGIMAKNPEWCQPINAWKKYFKDWLIVADPETLIKTKIFFDFRHVFGDKKIASSLKSSLNKNLQNKSPFFWQLAKTMLLFKPPLSIFGNIEVETEGEHKSEISIKKAITPIVDIVRIYSLKNAINTSNTFERLALLHEKEILNKNDYQEILRVFEYLMQLRLQAQAKAIANNLPPDNYINPKSITKIDKALLKESFSIIECFQNKMSLDFTGRMNPNLF
jgi:CBS domain-containing protein